MVLGGATFLETVFPGRVMQRLGAVARVGPPVSTPELLADPGRLRDVEYLFTTWGAPKLETALLENAPQLRAVLHAAGSVRRIMTDAVWERGLAVASAYAINAQPTAEYTLGAILLANKRVWHHLVAARRKRFIEPADFAGRSACAGNAGSVVGLVSYGTVGRAVRRLLAPFALRVLVYDPHLAPSRVADEDIELVGLEELFVRADVVSVHTPLLPETTGLIRGHHLASMRPNSTFINTARGAVVDEPELIAVLAERPDLQAVLDVTAPEPPVPGSPLYELPNVVLTPHLAGSLGPECAQMAAAMVEEMERHVRGEALRWLITPERLRIMA